MQTRQYRQGDVYIVATDRARDRVTATAGHGLPRGASGETRCGMSGTHGTGGRLDAPSPLASPEMLAILVLRAAGYTDLDAAFQLGLSVSQVRARINRLMDTYGAGSVVHALAVAVVRGDVTVADLRGAGVW